MGIQQPIKIPILQPLGNSLVIHLAKKGSFTPKNVADLALKDRTALNDSAQDALRMTQHNIPDANISYLTPLSERSYKRRNSNPRNFCSLCDMVFWNLTEGSITSTASLLNPREEHLIT